MFLYYVIFVEGVVMMDVMLLFWLFVSFVLVSCGLYYMKRVS